MTNCPVLSMPIGRLADGRHVGIQLVAAPREDALVLAAAAALEAALDAKGPLPAPSASAVCTATTYRGALHTGLDISSPQVITIYGNKYTHNRSRYQLAAGS